MSDTPRVDDAICRHPHPAWPEGRQSTVNGEPVVTADFARQLERELNNHALQLQPSWLTPPSSPTTTSRSNLTMKYSLIPQPRTSPPRYMIADGDTIIARNLLRSTARRVIAALLLSDLRTTPTAAQTSF